MKRLLACLTLVSTGVAVAFAPSGNAAAPPHPTSVAGVQAAYTPPPLTWGACTDPYLVDNHLQCATMTVPLDYAHPDGTKIQIALSRKLHTSATSKGVIIGNPGGPGGSGTWIPVLADYVPNGVGNDYDWVGFDPRGVGASTPSLHCTQSYFGNNRPNYTPKTNAILRYWVNKNRKYANRCGASAAKALLPHMTTVDVADDLESMRIALGQTKLNYYGFSYGTYLGQVYATRYPSHVGRMILDGVVNSRRAWYGANLDQDVAFDKNMDVYWQWVAKHNKQFHLGKSWKKIKAGYYKELKKLDRHAAAGGKFGPDELGDVILDAGYYVYDWNTLAIDYSQLIRHGRAHDLWVQYRDGNQGDDNEFAVYNAVQCSEAHWPGLPRTLADSRKINKAHPFLTWGNTWYNAPCLNWPAKHGSRLTAINGRALTSKILLISETKDAATPYSGALATRLRFPTASLIAGVNGTTHASSLSGVGCVDVRIANYLATGAVPARHKANAADVRCPRVPPPAATSAGARTTASAGMPASLRARLMAAQAYSLG